MNSMMLDEVTVFKYLDVKVDCNLNFKAHVQWALKIYPIKFIYWVKLGGFLNVKASQMVYNPMILPLMDIGDVFYNSTMKSFLNKLQCLQNRALCIIFSLDKRTNTDKAHQDMKLLRYRIDELSKMDG